MRPRPVLLSQILPAVMVVSFLMPARTAGAQVDSDAPAAREAFGALVKTPVTHPDVAVEVHGTTEADGLRVEDVSWVSLDEERVRAFVVRPAAAKGRLPAIVCLHGSGGSRDSLVTTEFGHGSWTTPGRARPHTRLLGWARELARRGYLTLSITQRGLDDRGPPINQQANVMLIRGRTAMGAILHEIRQGVTHLVSRSDVDPTRIGATGMSFGGITSFYAWLLDDRLAAAAPVCGGVGSVDLFARMGQIGYHGTYWWIPGIVAEGDQARFAAAMAPRPLMLWAPTEDVGMPKEAVDAFVARVSPAYERAGAPGAFVVHQPPGKHTFSLEAFEAMERFFARQLGGQSPIPPEPEGRAEGPAPVKILFDSDMGSDCDDAGALALLHAYADEGRAEIIGCVYSSGRVPYGAGVIEAINIYYGRPDIPVGAAHDDRVGDPVDKMTAEKLARDQAAFGNRIVHNHDAPEQTRLCRKLLAAQPDRSVTYLTVGHTKGLHDLLVSEPDDLSPFGGFALIERKVRRWVAMGAQGAANEARHRRKDWNLCRNGSAPFTDLLIDRFPRPVVFVGTGTDVLTGRSLADTPPGNIVRTVYRDWLWNHEQKTLEDQRPSWDLVAALFAVEGRGDFLVDAGDGHLDFDPEEGYRWEPGPGPNDQTLLHQKPGVSEDLAAHLNEMIARVPAAHRER